MGIRFDKDSRRPTNGPMIFFSDPTTEMSISDEIRSAVESRLSFYAYRLPGDMIMAFGSSESVVEGIGTPGFVIALFNPNLPYLTIPYKDKASSKDSFSNKTVLADSICDFPSHSTSRDEHRNEIHKIKEALNQIGDGKIVASRVIINEGAVDIGATFSSLCRSHPDALVFCFSTPLTGCWIGATPELLLKSGKEGVETMALAGTRKSGSLQEWDPKNIEEQEFVTADIVKTLRQHSFTPTILPTFTKKAGKVEHICTPIEAIPATQSTPSTLSALLHKLSPTPALCGTPRELALDIIKNTEDFDRGCYGGFCGPYHSPSDFSFYVTLRCARIQQKRFCMFAGGGITKLSDPDSEWEETEIKSTTLSDSIRLQS